MRIYVNCTSNLGDFMNAMPVLSGIAQKAGRINLLIKGGMKKFVGFQNFLMYQGIFDSVSFDDEMILLGDSPYILSSWTRFDRNNTVRPIETCRYENWFKDNYKLDFDVDDDFELKINDDIGIYGDDTKHYYDAGRTAYCCGDRWGPDEDPGIDTRRKTNLLKDTAGTKFFLDYSKDIMWNSYVVKYCKPPFITTFTGIGIIADLMKKETIVCWDEDMRTWDGHPVSYDFERHYYGDRNAKLVYIKDLKKYL